MVQQLSALVVLEFKPDVMAHTFNPSIWWAEAVGSLSSRLPWVYKAKTWGCFKLLRCLSILTPPNQTLSFGTVCQNKPIFL